MFQCNIPTKYEKTLIKGFFTQLFEFFPKSFSTKNEFVLPESYKLFDINKKSFTNYILTLIYQVHG